MERKPLRDPDKPAALHRRISAVNLMRRKTVRDAFTFFALPTLWERMRRPAGPY